MSFNSLTQRVSGKANLILISIKRPDKWCVNNFVMHHSPQSIEQTYVKADNYITCPIDYKEKLFLLNYSMNT